MSALGSFADAWCTVALAATWQLAALAVLAFAIERVLRLRQPHARHSLWWFVLLAPLLLAPVRLALSARDAVVTVAPPAAVTRAVSFVQPPSPAAEATPVFAPTSSVNPRVHVAAPPTPWWADLPLETLIAAVWLVGCAFFAARLVVGHMRVRQVLRGSAPVEDPAVTGALSELCDEAGVLGTVTVRASDAVGAPVLYGTRSPTILVPSRWLGAISPDDLRALLAHEVAHIARHDFLMTAVQRLIEVPLFFHPAIWLARQRIALAREELCDAWALGRGVDAGSYARSLAAAAERAETGFGLASVGVAEGKSALLRRVEAVMQWHALKRLSRPLVVGLAALALVSAVAFAAVQIRQAAPATDAEADTRDERLEARQLQGEMEYLGKAILRYLADSGGIFPPTDDVAEVRELLAPYMKSQVVFTRRLRYVMPAGISLAEIETPTYTPVAIAEDDPEYDIVLHVNGSLRHVDKGAGEDDRRIIDIEVLDENSAPAAGAEIRILGDARSEVLHTDERGWCPVVVERRRGAPSFHIRSSDGSVARIVTVFFTAGREGAEKTVVLSAADERANTVSISGRVLDDRGRPVAGARLWLYCNHATMGGSTFLSREIGLSGEDGEFSRTMLRLAVGNTGWGSGWMEPWNYQVVAHKPGYGFGWAQAHGDPEVHGIEVSLGRADSLQGTVRDADGELLANVLVGVERIEVAGASLAPEGLADAPAWMQTRTDEKGRFVLADLPADATVELGVSTYGAGDSYRAGQMGPDLSGIKLAEQRGDVDIKLRQMPAISGVLLTPDGQPASGVKVELEGRIRGRRHSTFMHSEVTDERGRYEFDLSVAGTWTLWVTDERHSGTLAKDLEVDLGEVVTLPDTVLGASAVVEGRVLDAVSGDPVAGVPVHYHPSPVDAGRTEVMGSTGADGAFRIGVPPGKISVGYAGPPPGYTWNHRVSDEMIDGRPLVRVTADQDKPSRVPLEVKPGEVVTGVTLYVAPEATLEGTVLDADGKPWRHGGFADVDLDRELVRSDSYPPSGGSVDTDGTFRSRYLYSGVPVVATVYHHERKLAGGARARPRVGEDTRVTIEMKPLATAVGRVLMPDGSPADGVSVHPSGMAIGPGNPAVRTGGDGRFSVPGGIVGTACSAYVEVPSGTERWETGGELKFRGRSKSVPVTSPDDVIDVGDIVLEPHIPGRPVPTASASVRPAPPTGAAGGAEGEIVRRPVTLEFVPAEYLAYLFGSADVPGGSGADSPPGVYEFAGDLVAGLEHLPGLCADWLPEGVDAPVAYAPLNALLVRGTEAGVERLSDLLEQLDRRPQQIIFEIASFPGLPVDLNAAEFVFLTAPGAVAPSGAYVPAKAYYLGRREVRSVKRPDVAWFDFSRVATTSLVPTMNTTTVGPEGAMSGRVLVLMPRVSDDGAIAVSVRLVETGTPEGNSDAAGLALMKSAPAATVSVGDGETFGLVFARGDDKVTVIAKAQLVK